MLETMIVKDVEKIRNEIMAPSDLKKIIAIDGPAGSGKSSVAKKLAEKLGWVYFSTGALYRAVAYLAKKEGIAWEELEKYPEFCQQLENSLSWDPHTNKISYQGQTLSKELFSEDSSRGASVVAKLKIIRHILLPIQRRFVENCTKGVVVEGRDMGTVVFPNAAIKIYLTASLEERAKRRLQQIYGKETISPEVIEATMKEIEYRDARDSKREESPLKKAEDAVWLDTSSLSQDEVLTQISDIVKQKKLVPPH